MPDNESVSETARIDQRKPVERSEMISFLTSTGKIKEVLAGSLYDSGLDDWDKLAEGDEAYFTSFKNVGKKRVDDLMELSEKKRQELQSHEGMPDLREVLSSVPRMTGPVIDSLYESGYDSFSKYAGIEQKELQKIRGVGPKLSGAIIDAVKEAVEKFDIPFESIEEATAEMMKEEEETTPLVEDGTGKQGSLMDRIINAIKGFFGGKKDEPPSEVETAPQEKEEASEEEKAEPPSGEGEAEETAVTEEKSEEEGPTEEVVEETAAEPVVESPDEVPVETDAGIVVEDAAPPEPMETPENIREKAEEPKKDEAGFFQRIKEMFFGRKDETVSEETPAGGEKPEVTSGEPQEEILKEEEEGKEENPSEVEPLENPGEGSGKGSTSITEFEDIPGVSGKTADILRRSGYHSLDELREAVPEDLVMIDGIGEKTAKKICGALRE